jgi:hypothetical protein
MKALTHTIPNGKRTYIWAGVSLLKLVFDMFNRVTWINRWAKNTKDSNDVATCKHRPSKVHHVHAVQGIVIKECADTTPNTN